MKIHEKLLDIQTTLKAPKGQFNSFGKYQYRNCEDILESLKPLLKKNKAVLLVNDDVVSVSNRIYIKATVTLQDVESEEKIETSAFAREEDVKKGMDGSQITGSSSSYARKYALNAMFAIDDTKDSDATNQGENKENTKTTTQSKTTGNKKGITEEDRPKLLKYIQEHKETYEKVTKTFKLETTLENTPIKKLETLCTLIKQEVA